MLQKLKNTIQQLIGLRPTNIFKTRIGEFIEMNEVKMVNVEEARKEVAREELINRIKAMDDVELQIVADTIPVELCIARIQKELRQKELLENTLAASMELVKSV